jgi:hypothetical protein
MSYFGIIKMEEVVGLSVEETKYLLLEKEIYLNAFTLDTLEKIIEGDHELDFKEMKTEPLPPPELVDEFNEFIFQTYRENVISSKFNYFSMFNEDFYGLEYSDSRKIALSDFNEIYKNLNITHITLVDERVSKNGTNETHTTGKIFKLYFFQQEIKKSMATTENLINYLIGNLEFYSQEFYEETFEIQDGVHLESIKQILVEINDKYNFEEDLYYSKKVREAFKFRDYDYIFKTLKAYQFTNRMISNFKTIKRTYIESIYQVLLEFDLIEDHKENFIAFIKDEYRFILPKITTFAPKQNIQNDKRVMLLTQEWENNDVQKTNLDMFLNI